MFLLLIKEDETRGSYVWHRRCCPLEYTTTRNRCLSNLPAAVVLAHRFLIRDFLAVVNKALSKVLNRCFDSAPVNEGRKAGFFSRSRTRVRKKKGYKSQHARASRFVDTKSLSVEDIVASTIQPRPNIVTPIFPIVHTLQAHYMYRNSSHPAYLQA